MIRTWIGRAGWLAALMVSLVLTGCATTRAPATQPANARVSSAATAPSVATTIPPLDIPAAPPDADGYRRLAVALDRSLRTELLDPWFPRCVDREHGGFQQAFAEDWTPRPEAARFLVFQARMTWVAAAVAQYDPALREAYLPIARHGMDYLDRVMRDPDAGGLYYQVDVTGQPTVAPYGTEKHAYALSFVIYAGSAAFQATRQPRAQALALGTFRWLDEHAHDEANGGYYEALRRDGTPILIPPRRDTSGGTGAPGRDGIGTPYGYKSMNTHIHLLEAITALYQARPRGQREPLVHQRLEEMLALVRDRIAVDPGCLNYYFTPDWRPVPMHDSFGHDIETAYLLVEAAAALGRADDPATWRVARALVDHALDYGWDAQRGGFYEGGQAFAGAHDKTKGWWTQAEGLNALLLMHQRYGRETDRYWRAFALQLRFIWDCQIDHRHGGWYAELTEDGQPRGDRGKGSMWKAAYHDGRALMNVVRMLRELGEKKE